MKNPHGFPRLKFFTRANIKEISAGEEDFGGFTMVELMIATTVFSIVLLVIASALILAGRVYFKGVVSVRTQEVAREIADDISQNIQFAGGNIQTSTGGGMCIGNRQYSYILNKEYIGDSAHKFIVSTVPSCGSSSPLSTAAMNSLTLTAGQQELLGNNMRLTTLNVNNIGGYSNLYRVDIGVAYGDDDVFDAIGHCINAAGSQYCATADISTTVDRRN